MVETRGDQLGEKCQQFAVYEGMTKNHKIYMVLSGLPFLALQRGQHETQSIVLLLLSYRSPEVSS